MVAISGESLWITGASSGLGRAMALRLAQQGNRVFVSARGSEALEQLADSHDNIIAIVFDVSCEDQINTVSRQISQHTDYIDRVIINAGTCEYLDITAPDWEMMRRVMAVNYFGAINTLAVALPLLKARPNGRGHIVGIVSLVTVVPFARAEAYGASKAAMQYMLDSLRIDLADDRIDVTVVNPGFVKTPLTDNNDFPMPFLMSVDRAAERIVRAIGSRPRQYDFPKRFKWLLKTLGFVPLLWNKLVAPLLKI